MVCWTGRWRAPEPCIKAGPVFIGRQGAICNCNFFCGQIDEVRIWNVVRSTAEIQANFHRQLAGDEPGLSAYWRFDEGFGPTVSDSADHGSTGTLTNGAAWVASTAPVGAPSAAPLAATDLTGNTATLNGTVNPRGQPGFAYFNYGVITNYGNTSSSIIFSAESADIPITVRITSLVPHTIYHFQLVASNSAGLNSGDDMTFTTTDFADVGVVLPGVFGSDDFRPCVHGGQ